VGGKKREELGAGKKCSIKGAMSLGGDRAARRASSGARDSTEGVMREGWNPEKGKRVVQKSAVVAHHSSPWLFGNLTLA